MRRLWPRALGGLLSLVTLLVVAAPFGVSWYLADLRRHVSGQRDTPVTRVDPADLRRFAETAGRLPDRAAPVVVAYHDIRPHGGDPAATAPAGREHYVVTPEAFDAQLTALHTAGYRTISSAQYVDYLRGGSVPARSVYLTFDDGTRGLWTYADPILERHRMVAASYLITGHVDTHRPYYLSWAEVSRMSRSGRWDFQAHTHDLHTRVQTAPGQLGSPLTHRRWEPATGTRESLAAYRQRLTADFDAMFTAFTAHQLPRPRLFAYPFSEIGDVTTDPEAAAFSRDLIAARFVGALTNKSLAPEPSSRRSAADGQVERAEVYATTDTAELVSAVVERTAVPAVVTDPFARAWDWRDQHGEPMTELSPLTAGRFTADSPRRAYGTLLAYASADWTGYTADATVRGLRTDGGTVTLLVGVNGDATVSVRVAYGRVALLRAGRVVAEAALTPAAGHRIAVTVRDGETVARVDGGPVLRVVTPTGPGATGGLAVAIDDAQGRPHPSVAALTVTTDG
ncbi:Polysaccharide deacetylase [Micromonospora matsumotoense]|uniref:Polysaccharide deacetylase n=1 Tax=Micromonospora matsumotoense TaxID=121616 RepID=A0A1C4XAN9_9ACTN|nr:polysaccharide deacetylase family protein [Micromonospora matsumotoense]SCF05580.1 Polysaccharide deacetylase [Micromonospora matsumotoense]